MTTVHVEVDLYSGRVNPAWDLNDADAERFVTRVGALQRRSGGGPAAPEGLGYRGLHVTLSSDGAIERFSIADGTVTTDAATTSARSLHDPDRRFEKWLLETGKEQLGADLFEHLLTNR
jgi:hypothetical protein